MYAARCAFRVRVLSKDEAVVRAIEDAVCFSLIANAGGRASFGAFAAANSTAHSHASEAAAYAARAAGAAAYTAYAAYAADAYVAAKAAADYSAYAAGAAAAETAAAEYDAATNADAYEAYGAYAAEAVRGHRLILQATLHDFDALKCLSGEPTLDALGPIWPFGKPSWAQGEPHDSWSRFVREVLDKG